MVKPLGFLSTSSFQLSTSSLRAVSLVTSAQWGPWRVSNDQSHRHTVLLSWQMRRGIQSWVSASISNQLSEFQISYNVCEELTQEHEASLCSWNSSAHSVRVSGILCWFGALQVGHWPAHLKAPIGLVSRAECEQFKSVRTTELLFLPLLLEENRAQCSGKKYFISSKLLF